MAHNNTTSCEALAWQSASPDGPAVVDFAPLPGEHRVVPFKAAAVGSPYLTTDEAAAYLRKSVSWLLRVPDRAFLRGKPNLDAKSDLDAWVERHKFKPKVKA